VDDDPDATVHHSVIYGQKFRLPPIGQIAGVRTEPKEVPMRIRGGISFIGLIYILIGIFVAWDHDYITIGLLKRVLSALLAIFLWFLVLLGVSLHVT
jgi:hypothetical protein